MRAAEGESEGRREDGVAGEGKDEFGEALGAHRAPVAARGAPLFWYIQRVFFFLPHFPYIPFPLVLYPPPPYPRA